MTDYAFLGLGTNLGDREEFLHKALDLIGRSAGRIDSLSDIYETEPWGFQSENNFLNMVIRIRTKLGPSALLQRLQSIEDQLGRDRDRDSKSYISRTIDIDILLLGNKVINKADLIIPHPMIGDRKFVLVPLCDIAPNLIHPVLNKTFAELLEECKDEREVKRYSPLSFSPGGGKKT
ncbi:MAG: 2-amino-4-hydroxy-6-hydroxymethyldihydropteridine diphosphokinase [Bacteroidota bacterium]|nr:2-amino-4-hydroxy-6-hydroxymethyldihydropteridine diphosphokinase [Bacteroidota bacterium]